MEEPEYRVYIRIPIERPPGFVDPPSFVWNAEKEGMLWKAISARGRGDIHWPELAEVLQVDVPFLLQQAQMLYEKQLEELQLQMKRVHSSASLTQSKESGDSGRTSGQFELPALAQRVGANIRHTPSPLSQTRSSRNFYTSQRLTAVPRTSTPNSPHIPVQSSFGRRKSSTSSPLVPDFRKSSGSVASSSSGERSNSSAAALQLFKEQELRKAAEHPPEDDEGPAFLPSSPQTSRPQTAHNNPPAAQPAKDGDGSNQGSDSFSDLSDASVSKSALEEALEEHLRKGGSVVSQMPAGVRSIWKGKFTS